MSVPACADVHTRANRRTNRFAHAQSKSHTPRARRVFSWSREPIRTRAQKDEKKEHKERRAQRERPFVRDERYGTREAIFHRAQRGHKESSRAAFSRWRALSAWSRSGWSRLCRSRRGQGAGGEGRVGPLERPLERVGDCAGRRARGPTGQGAGMPRPAVRTTEMGRGGERRENESH